MRLAVCDVRGCSNLVDSSSLVHFPPISRTQDRVVWWQALFGRLNFRLSPASAKLTSVCHRHFSDIGKINPVPDTALPARKDAMEPVPSQLLREGPTLRPIVRTYSRKSGGDAPMTSAANTAAAPVRYKPIAPAARQQVSWPRVQTPGAAAAPVLNQLMTPAAAQQQYQILPAAGATVSVRPTQTFQVLPTNAPQQLSLAGASSGGVIQLVQSGGGQVGSHGSQIQLMSASGAAGQAVTQAAPYRLNGPLLAPGSASVASAGSQQYQLVPTSGGQLLLMPSQQAVTQVSGIQPSLPLVVVNSNGQEVLRSRSSAPATAPALATQPAPGQSPSQPPSQRPAAVQRARILRRGRGRTYTRTMAVRHSPGAELSISLVESLKRSKSEAVPRPGDKDEDVDVEVIDVAFGLPENKGGTSCGGPAALEPKQEVILVPDDESDDADNPSHSGGDSQGKEDFSVTHEQGSVRSEDDAGCAEQDSPRPSGDCSPAGDAADPSCGEPAPADAAVTAAGGATVKREPAETNGGAAPCRSAERPGAAPSLIRLKPLSELTSAAAERQEEPPPPPPPRVPTPPGISLGGGDAVLSEADLMLLSLEARQRREEMKALLPPLAKRPRTADGGAAPPDAAAGPPPAVRILPGNTYLLEPATAAQSTPPPPALQPSVSADRFPGPVASFGPSRRTPLQIVRGNVASSRRKWRERGAHMRYRGQDAQLGMLVNQLLNKTMRSMWQSISESLEATSNRDTLVGLINHFILIEKLGMQRPERDDADPPEPAGAQQNGHASPQPTAPEATQDVQGFSLPVGLSITPLTQQVQPPAEGSGEGQGEAPAAPPAAEQQPPAGGQVTITPVSALVTPDLAAGPPPAETSPSADERRRSVRMVACRLCGAGGFERWMQVNEHMRLYHRERNVLFVKSANFNPGLYVVCALCPVVTPTVSESVRHAAEAHPDLCGGLAAGAAKLRCDVCMLVLGHSAEATVQHSVKCRRMDGRPPTYTCVPCSAFLNTPVEVHGHVDDHIGGRLGYKARCQLCPFSSDFASCRRHVRAVHNEHCFLLGCALCPSFGTDKWVRAERHVCRLHRTDAEPELNACSVCGLRLTGGVRRMNQHLRMHRTHKVVSVPAHSPDDVSTAARPEQPRQYGRGLPGGDGYSMAEAQEAAARPLSPPPADDRPPTTADDRPPDGDDADVLEVKPAVLADAALRDEPAGGAESPAPAAASPGPSSPLPPAQTELDPKLAMRMTVRLRRLGLMDFQPL